MSDSIRGGYVSTTDMRDNSRLVFPLSDVVMVQQIKGGSAVALASQPPTPEGLPLVHSAVGFSDFKKADPDLVEFTASKQSDTLMGLVLVRRGNVRLAHGTGLEMSLVLGPIGIPVRQTAGEVFSRLAGGDDDAGVNGTSSLIEA